MLVIAGRNDQDEDQDSTGALVQAVGNTLTSEHSRRAYGAAVWAFLNWYRAAGRRCFDAATVEAWKVKLCGDGLSAATVNMRLCAVRKLAAVGVAGGYLDAGQATGVQQVKGVKQAGVRSGRWLTQDEAQRLLGVPDVSTLRGVRDRAMLAVMLGCGLRRSEVAALRVDHVQKRDGRWVIVDMVGKGGRVRSVPMPSFAKTALDGWLSAAGVTSGRVFRSMQGGRVCGDGLSAAAVGDVVKLYSEQAGVKVAAHDLRRTFAKLAYRNGAPIDQVQLSLGHQSIVTTQRYLGTSQDLQNAPCDRLGLSL